MLGASNKDVRQAAIRAISLCCAQGAINLPPPSLSCTTSNPNRRDYNPLLSEITRSQVAGQPGIFNAVIQLLDSDNLYIKEHAAYILAQCIGSGECAVFLFFPFASIFQYH